jgi:hypothetical protein
MGSPVPGFWLGVEKFTCASHSHSLVDRPLHLDILPGIVVCYDHASCFGPHAQTPHASSFTAPGSFPPPIFTASSHEWGVIWRPRKHHQKIRQTNIRNKVETKSSFLAEHSSCDLLTMRRTRCTCSSETAASSFATLLFLF